MTNSNKYTLKHLNSVKTEGIIWKMVFDDELNQIAWECRTTQKELYVYVLDFNNCKLLLNKYLINDGWSFSLDLIKNNNLYFSHYEQEFSPIKKGISCLNILNKSIDWQNFSVAVESYTIEGALVYDARIFPRKYQLLNYLTGQLTKLEDDFYQTLENKIQIPENVFNDKLIEETDILKFKDLVIKSFYQESNHQINQKLNVCLNESVVFEDVLNTGIQKKYIQPFVVWQNKLLYIKNKSEFVSYLV